MSTLVTVLIAVFASITAPLVIVYFTNRQRSSEMKLAAKIRREEVEESHRREDAVAERAKKAAEDLANSQERIALQAQNVALQAREAASLLLAEQRKSAEKTDEVATQTREAAALLLAEQQKSNEATIEVARVAAQSVAAQEKTAKDLNGKLDQVHTLVNSAYDAALDGKLSALEQSLTLMHEVRALRDRDNGSDEGVVAVEATNLSIIEEKVAELKALIADRAVKNRQAKAQLQESEVIVRVGAGPPPEVNVARTDRDKSGDS